MNSLLMALNWLMVQTDIDKAEEEAKICIELVKWYKTKGLLTPGVYEIIIRDINTKLESLRNE